MKIERYFHFSDASSAEELVELLTRAGYSNTKARRAVIDALAETDGPVTPNGLFERARERHAALGLVTVYRTLEILESLGLVRKLHLAEGCHSYVLSTPQVAPAQPRDDGHGHHVICQQCHRAVEFAGCDIDGIVAAVQAQTGFAVRDHWLEMFGLCPACQEKSS